MNVIQEINRKLNALIGVVKSTQWVDGECPVCGGTQKGGHVDNFALGKSCAIDIAIKEFEEK